MSHILCRKKKRRKQRRNIERNRYRNDRFVFFFLRNAETMIHLLKSSLGTGILAMPQAICYAGYILGFVGTISIGLICVYSLQILLKSHYELCRRKKVLS